MHRPDVRNARPPSTTLSPVSRPGGLTERGEAPPVGAYYYYSTRTTTTTTNPAGAVLGTDGAWQLLSLWSAAFFLPQLAPLQITSHNRHRVTFPRHISDTQRRSPVQLPGRAQGVQVSIPKMYTENTYSLGNSGDQLLDYLGFLLHLCTLRIWHGIYSYVTFERYH